MALMLKCAARLVFTVTVIFGLAQGHALGGSLPASGFVEEVYDGDTIVLRGGQRVRYLGIDAPEVAHESKPGECFGEEARRRNAELVMHQMVHLSYDIEKHDKHGRLLAYVVLPGGKDVAAEMIRSGCAYVYRTSLGLLKTAEFLSLQREAIRKRTGMWGACTVKPSVSYIGNRGSFVFHRGDCVYGKKTAPNRVVSFPTRWSAFEEGYRPCRFCEP